MDKQEELIQYLEEVHKTAPQKHVAALSKVLETLRGASMSLLSLEKIMITLSGIYP